MWAFAHELIHSQQKLRHVVSIELTPLVHTYLVRSFCEDIRSLLAHAAIEYPNLIRPIPIDVKQTRPTQLQVRYHIRSSLI